ncbi:hypothetical protein PTI98_000701 [Pleurotus ostreatus]|nr:hypothetical protein PTI98_000701 [Pleurotus ostreatus]
MQFRKEGYRGFILHGKRRFRSNLSYILNATRRYRKDCELQIRNFAGAVHKSFATHAEAERFVLETGLGENKSVKRKSNEREDEGGAPGSEPEFEEVYCDGACKNNGNPDAVAGIGIWWGPDDPRNEAFRCPGAQTNNRAELIAIIMVLLSAPMDGKPLIIKSDSDYSRKCLGEWSRGWIQKNWVTSSGQPVKNRGIIKYLLALLNARQQWGHKVEIKWVKGHAGIVGNEGADQLANLGCTYDEEEDWDWEAKTEQFNAVFQEELQKKNQLEAKGKKRAKTSPFDSCYGNNTSASFTESELLYILCFLAWRILILFSLDSPSASRTGSPILAPEPYGKRPAPLRTRSRRLSGFADIPDALLLLPPTSEDPRNSIPHSPDDSEMPGTSSQIPPSEPVASGLDSETLQTLWAQTYEHQTQISSIQDTLAQIEGLLLTPCPTTPKTTPDSELRGTEASQHAPSRSENTPRSRYPKDYFGFVVYNAGNFSQAFGASNKLTQAEQETVQHDIQTKGNVQRGITQNGVMVKSTGLQQVSGRRYQNLPSVENSASSNLKIRTRIDHQKILYDQMKEYHALGQAKDFEFMRGLHAPFAKEQMATATEYQLLNALGRPDTSSFATYGYGAGQHIDKDESVTFGYVTKRSPKVPRSESNFVWGDHKLIVELAEGARWIWRASRDRHGSTANSVALSNPNNWRTMCEKDPEACQWTRVSTIPRRVAMAR